MPYNPALDGLRCLAVLAVLAFHCGVPGADGGFVGVDLFFVLSGFLITGLLTMEYRRDGGVDLRRFWCRRLLRLLPAAAAVLAGYAMLAPFLWPDRPVGEHAAAVALTGAWLSDYSRAFWRVPDLLSHSWSLAVEMKFYLLWPVALIWLCRRATHPWAAAMGLYLAATMWRWASVYLSAGWDVIYYRMDTHAAGLFLGAALALMPRPLSPGPARVAGIAGVAGLVACVTMLRWGEPRALLLGITAAEISAALLIAAAADGILRRALSWQPLVAVGVVSYGVYLWHYPIARAVRETASWSMTLLLTITLSLTLATASWYLVEQPIRRLARRQTHEPKRADEGRRLIDGDAVDARFDVPNRVVKPRNRPLTVGHRQE